MLTDRVKQEIRDDSVNKKIESCGIVLFNKSYFTFPCENVSEYGRDDSFSIDPRGYLKASYLGEIIGFYHSHINDLKEASEIDKVRVNDEKKPWIIYHVKSDFFNLIYPETYRNPYIGRAYQIGKSDCFSLIKDYYQRELNVTLPEFERDDNWAEKNPNLMEENYEENGFTKVNIPRKNDLVIIKYKERNIGGHLGVYLGNNLFLHHPPGRFSLIEPYTNSYKKRTYAILRHG